MGVVLDEAGEAGETLRSCCRQCHRRALCGPPACRGYARSARTDDRGMYEVLQPRAGRLSHQRACAALVRSACRQPNGVPSKQ